MTTARANGTEVTKAVDKDLLVGANRCAGQHDPDAPPGSPRARSRIARAMLYAHDACFLALFAPPQPEIGDPRARPSWFMHRRSRVNSASGEMFPVTRELQLVSMSVGPRYRYSRAVLKLSDTLSMIH